MASHGGMSVNSPSSMAGPPSSYYPSNPSKYQENGHDTFSDFVTLVCQEAQNSNPSSQVCIAYQCF